MKKRIRKLIYATIALILIFVAYTAYHVKQTVDDSYAAWHTTMAVAAYIVRNEGKLPSDWDDLVNADPNFNLEDIQEFQKRIEIRFQREHIQIETKSGRSPIYNKPNEDINQVIQELNLPREERRSRYWNFQYPPLSNTE